MGAQACKKPCEEKVIEFSLVNSNPATIMTDRNLRMLLMSSHSPWRVPLKLSRKKNLMLCYLPSEADLTNLSLELFEKGVLEANGTWR